MIHDSSVVFVVLCCFFSVWISSGVEINYPWALGFLILVDWSQKMESISRISLGFLSFYLKSLPFLVLFNSSLITTTLHSSSRRKWDLMSSSLLYYTKLGLPESQNFQVVSQGLSCLWSQHFSIDLSPPRSYLQDRKYCTL